MKKGKNRKFAGKREPEPERGFRVLDMDGRPPYLPAHPDGISKADAERLSRGLAIDTQVVPISQ